jgi:hypothetical protein
MTHDKNTLSFSNALRPLVPPASEGEAARTGPVDGADFKKLFQNKNLNLSVPAGLQEDGSAPKDLAENLKGEKTAHIAVISSKIRSFTSMMGSIDTSTPEGMALYNYYMGQVRLLEQEKSGLLPLDKYNYRYS